MSAEWYAILVHHNNTNTAQFLAVSRRGTDLSSRPRLVKLCFYYVRVGMIEHEPCVLSYQHDAHRLRASEALHSLRKVASLVKPIMRRRDWRVHALCEFVPSNRHLLGLNVNTGGCIKIYLRLRHAGDERQFLPLDQVTDTMLHELTHIVHGPHNKDFHSLWNQLRDEHMELAIKGYTGEGFLSAGRRLGGNAIFIPPHEARRRATAAAERRRNLTKNSGRRLGGVGPSPRTKADVRKLMAEAAQRRIDVTRGCASGTSESIKLADDASKAGTMTQASEGDGEQTEQAILQAYIDLIEQEEREQERKGLGMPEIVDLSNSDAPSGNDGNDGDDDEWTCLVCTLINPPTYLACDACASERPQTRPHPLPVPSGSQASSTLPAIKKPRTIPAKKREKEPSVASRNPRRNAIQALIELETNSQKPGPNKLPVGWLCSGCGTFMERQWFTCAGCGRIKKSAAQAGWEAFE